jgi:hypothetical protein
MKEVGQAITPSPYLESYIRRVLRHRLGRCREGLRIWVRTRLRHRIAYRIRIGIRRIDGVRDQRFDRFDRSRTIRLLLC